MESCTDCGRPARKRGYCNTDYERHRLAGELPALRPRDPVERFWSYVDRSATCWIWGGALSTAGYGRVQWGGRVQQAHRVAYELVVGPIPVGLELDHLCRVRNCVRPEHLDPVTTRENLLRGKGRSAANAAKTHCPQGHPYSGANLYLRNNNRGCVACRVQEGVKAAARQRAKRQARVLDATCVECGAAFSYVGHRRTLCSEHCRRIRNNRCARDHARRKRATGRRSGQRS